MECYNNIDLLLHNILADRPPVFTTVRSRFLYLIEIFPLSQAFINQQAYSLTPMTLKKLGSIFFNIHDKLLHQEYHLRELDHLLALFMLQVIYNNYRFINQGSLEYSNMESITLVTPSQEREIQDFFLSKQATNEFYCEKLECYGKTSEEMKTKHGFPLYKLTVITEEGNDLFVYLWLEKDPPSFHQEYNLLNDWLGDCINMAFPKIIFYHLAWSAKGYYFQTKETTFVLEPDYLVDITSIAECFQKGAIVPELYFFKYLRQKDFSLPIFKGNFINYLFDALLTQKDIDLESILESLCQDHLLKILDFTPSQFSEMLKEINDLHLPNIKQSIQFLEHRKVLLEPSFIAPDFGLQGRLDALFEDSLDSNHKSICELKSGTPPQYQQWANHFAQIMGYNLLLHSTYGFQRTGTSMVLYSKAKKEPLRNVPFSALSIRQIIMCRNWIVYYTLQIGRQKISLDQIIKKMDSSVIPSYHKADIQTYTSLYNSLRSYEKKYWKVISSFVIQEMVTEKIGYLDEVNSLRHGFSSLWLLSKQEKIELQIILPNLVIKKQNGHLFTFEFQTSNAPGGFRTGDLLVIYPMVENSSRTFSVPIYKAILKEIDEFQMIVQFRNELTTLASLKQIDFYAAERDIMESSRLNIISSMMTFFGTSPAKRDIFWGIKEPQSDYTTKDERATTTLERVLLKAAKMKDYLLIQGPPGTGKTSKYLIAIVKQHLKTNNFISAARSPKKGTSRSFSSRGQIVILAFTNRAVEEICQRLREHELTYILLGTQKSDEYHLSSLQMNCVDQQQQASTHPKLANFFPQMIKMKEHIKNTPLFVSTVANYQYEGIFLQQYILPELLIIDEASQLLESQLIGIIPHFTKFILLGDHFQLPAITLQNKEIVPADLSALIGLFSFKESLFERLYRRCSEKGWVQAYDLIPEHYRMHEEIANLVNPFYQGKLLAASARQRLKTTVFNLPSGKEHLKWRTLFFPTMTRSQTRSSLEEASKIVQLVQDIYLHYAEQFTENTIGIICAWRMQVNLVLAKLAPLPFAGKITVDTVERFQGSEREVIIYSTSISHESFLLHLQSLTADQQVDRKLNVAISRAREQFILIGNESILVQSPHYKRIIAMLKVLE